MTDETVQPILFHTMIRKPVLVFLMLIAMTYNIVHSQPAPFVPADFEVPQLLENNYFRIRMLSINDVVKDYDAVMTSIDHLQGVFGPGSGWPPADLTLEQDLVDLGWHQKEFQRRSSFAYTVMNPGESQCLGCVYIDPCPKQGYDAEVYLWVRQSTFEDGLDPVLFQTIREWISHDWPFEKVAYPGREIPWEAWEEMK